MDPAGAGAQEPAVVDAPRVPLARRAAPGRFASSATAGTRHDDHVREVEDVRQRCHVGQPEERVRADEQRQRPPGHLARAAPPACRRCSSCRRARSRACRRRAREFGDARARASRPGRRPTRAARRDAADRRRAPAAPRLARARVRHRRRAAGGRSGPGRTCRRGSRAEARCAWSETRPGCSRNSISSGVDARPSSRCDAGSGRSGG